MGRKKEHKKAKTCIHSYGMNEKGIVRTTMECPHHIHNVMVGRMHIVLANKCDTCKSYQKRKEK